MMWRVVIDGGCILGCDGGMIVRECSSVMHSFRSIGAFELAAAARVACKICAGTGVSLIFFQFYCIVCKSIEYVQAKR
jgi:hypothetical protein